MRIFFQIMITKILLIRSLDNRSMGYLVLVNNPEHNPEGDFGLLDDASLNNEFVIGF